MEKMDDGGRKTHYQVHNRNLIRTQQHLSISVDNDRSNLDALNKSQNPKIDSSNSKSTTNSDRIYSGLRGDPRLQQSSALITDQRNNCTNPVIKNSQKITEQKNEILSRTAADVIATKKLFKFLFYYFILFLIIFNAGFGVESAAIKQRDNSLISYVTRGSTSNRKFSYTSHGGRSPSWRRPEKRHRQINKNCKEHDITSRAFTADLIFEGKARSKRELGQYITFGIQKILKLEKSALRPKNQIRLHFGGKRNTNQSRTLLNDCLTLSIPNSEIDMRWKLKFGTNYFVFADLSGPMNYTAKGDPVVANKRNLKSIRSVIFKDRVSERPPRVRGLQDQALNANSELKLTCRIKGTPVPRLNWYKDGVPLIPSSHVNVTYYRKNSTIEIKSLETDDSGRYECRATSITGKTANMSANVNVRDIYADTTTDSDWPFRSVKCQVDSYCLNEGKCEFIERLGEHMCRCKSGYVGARCENKQLSTIGTSYVCGFNVGYSSYYC